MNEYTSREQPRWSHKSTGTDNVMSLSSSDDLSMHMLFVVHLSGLKVPDTSKVHIEDYRGRLLQMLPMPVV